MRVGGRDAGATTPKITLFFALDSRLVNRLVGKIVPFRTGWVTTAMSKSFELQVLRGAEWKIDSHFDCKESALEKAHDMEQFSPDVPLRVVEESFNPASGRIALAIIYRSTPPDEERQRLEEHFLTALRSANARLGVHPPATPLVPPQKRRPTLVGSLVTLVLAIGGIGLAAIYGLLWLGDVMH